MNQFPLRVMTAGHTAFSGEVQQCIVCTQDGYVGILAGHAPYAAPLGVGILAVYDGSPLPPWRAAVAQGYLEVRDGQVTVLARTCEWADEIDPARAQRAREQAQRVLADGQAGRDARCAAQRCLKKAENRLRAVQGQ